MKVILHTTQYIRRHQPQMIALVLLLLMIAFTISLDFLYTRFQEGAFYFSESFLFSSTYWLLYGPILKIQKKWAQHAKGAFLNLLFVPLGTVLHLLCYPLFVLAISNFAYSHTFSYLQTLQYGITFYLLKTVIIYSSATIIFFLRTESPLPAEPAKTLVHSIASPVHETTDQRFLVNILVSDGRNTRFFINVRDILYFEANSPYVSMYQDGKSYLVTKTLKSLDRQLDPNQFSRVHKSLIVNLTKVRTFRSRGNGDYDLMLSNGSLLRMSRNYATAFKSAFQLIHRLNPD